MDSLNYPEYLGDAVYATYDGEHVRITLNDHRNAPLVYLEPEVLSALVAYAKRVGALL